MHELLRKTGIGSIEALLIAVLAVMAIGLGLSTSTFLTLSNLFDLLNQSAVNIIFAVGLLVVLIAGGIGISFAVGASVTQYLTALAVNHLGGGNWALGFGFLLGALNATIIYRFRIVSIVVTIATFNLFFGGLMFVTGGVSIYDLPDWWMNRVSLLQLSTPSGVATLSLAGGGDGGLRGGHLVPAAPDHGGPPALCHRRQSGSRAPGGHPHRPHALPGLWLARHDERRGRADAGALRAGSGAQRALRARAGGAGRSLWCWAARAWAAGAARCSARSSASCWCRSPPTV